MQNLFDVDSYRKNYGRTLNEDIFNTRDLILDDKYSPVKGFNANIMLGMYEMTQWAVPFLYNYGVEKGNTESCKCLRLNSAFCK